MPELVLYSISLLAKHFFGTVLDIVVDQSDSVLDSVTACFPPYLV